jgi:hydroxyethylthiazole kinase-like uncharacterized protein yjeF
MTVHAGHGAPVYFTADVRAIEAAAAAAPNPPQLMERAGLAAAELARDVAGGAGRPVLILAGPGNNGGDAFVVARHLKQWYFKVTVVFSGDEKKLSADAAAALEAWRAAGGRNTDALPVRQKWGLVVDGVFGIGLEREVAGPYAGCIEAANGSGATVLAIDVPSGLQSDTGRVLGCAVRAHHTVTFIGLKPGLLTLEGPDHCGEIHLRTLDLDAQALRPARGFLIGEGVLAGLLEPRRRNTHKGDYGSIGIVGGDHGMVGAALLAGRAALKLGAGRVYIGLLAREPIPVDADQPELMIRSVEELFKLGHLNSLAVGPGLGQAPDAAYFLEAALGTPLPVVVDADALNLIAADGGLATRLRERKAANVLTPHPAEAARLLGVSTREVQDDRVRAATKLAAGLNSLVVLKGGGSICAAPDGTWQVNTSGNPGMASAGMGDVLTGMVAALIAQGATPQNALRAAVYLHGAAADRLVSQGIGPIGITAGEVADAARALLNQAIASPAAAD